MFAYTAATTGLTAIARTVSDASWTKEGRRAGKMTFAGTISEFYDEAGEIVVTGTSVSVTTSRVVDQ